jgi:hypothetical protein
MREASHEAPFYNLSAQARRERSERMKRLHADPEFAAKTAAAASERMKRLNAQRKLDADAESRTSGTAEAAERPSRGSAPRAHVRGNRQRSLIWRLGMYSPLHIASWASG